MSELEMSEDREALNHPHHDDGMVHVRHDFPDIRLAIHETRRWEAECKIILDEQNHQEVLDRGSLQAIAKEAK